MTTDTSQQAIANYDNAPYFAKALKYGVMQGIISTEKVADIVQEAAIGTLQIAEYFGESTHLRTVLETSKERMVRLVSLYLETSSDSLLEQAAYLLKEKPFRTLSRGGSQMLKALYALPESHHFGATRLESERDFLKKNLARGLSATQYQQALQSGQQLKQDLELANNLLKIHGTANQILSELYAPVDQVIRSMILLLSYGTKKALSNATDFPDETRLLEIFNNIRKEHHFLGEAACSTKFIEQLPVTHHATVNKILLSIQTEDIPKIVSASTAVNTIDSIIKHSKYFYVHDPLSAINQFDKTTSAVWNKLTGGSDDESTRLTLLLCASAGHTSKSTLKVADAKKIVLTIRQNGLLEDAVIKLIETAPYHEIANLKSLWVEFIDEARPYLQDQSDTSLKQVMSYLESRCNLEKSKAK